MQNSKEQNQTNGTPPTPFQFLTENQLESKLLELNLQELTLQYLPNETIPDFFCRKMEIRIAISELKLQYKMNDIRALLFN